MELNHQRRTCMLFLHVRLPQPGWWKLLCKGRLDHRTARDSDFSARDCICWRRVRDRIYRSLVILQEVVHPGLRLELRCHPLLVLGLRILTNGQGTNRDDRWSVGLLDTALHDCLAHSRSLHPLESRGQSMLRCFRGWIWRYCQGASLLMAIRPFYADLHRLDDRALRMRHPLWMHEPSIRPGIRTSVRSAHAKKGTIRLRECFRCFWLRR